MATTIAVTEDTRDRLKSYGRKGDTYEDVISRMMDIVDKELHLTDVYRRLKEKKKFIPLDELE